MIEFAQVRDGIYVARTNPFDVNTSLVIGDETALVIDTLSTGVQADELHAAIRSLTALPLTVLNTHSHFDHCFGNAVVAAGGRPIWAHANTAERLRDHGERDRADLAAAYRELRPELADDMAKVQIQVPDHLVRMTDRLDLGGRRVTITYHGRGHTDGDLVTTVDDADVIFAGDLIEEGAPPSLNDDSYPLEWPEALATILRTASSPTVIVPGHGGLVGIDFAARQHTQLAEFAWLIREGHADGATAEEIAARAPWPAEACRRGAERGLALLDDPVLNS
jgi:glyoxylase-like metal-dependent hydrolase (beta-lactamase superfamily II)